MNTQDVANRLVELCRQGKFDQAQEELYAQDAWSVEMKGAPTEVAQGMEAIKQKGEMFDSMFEIRGCEVSEPIVAHKHFSISMKLNAVNKQNGEVSPMDEICVYEVKEGKIVKEQFFYT